MNKILKVWRNHREEVSLCFVVVLMAINTLVVAQGLKSGLADFPGWPLWRMSLFVSALIIWLLWNADWDTAAFIAGVMFAVWLLLPASYLVVAFWTWELPILYPSHIIFTAECSTAFLWVISFGELVSRCHSGWSH